MKKLKKMFIISLIFTFIQASISSATEPNLVGWWKFDEGTGNIAYDSAGSNDGTIYGATWITGQIDGALNFDGVDDYVGCGIDTSLEPANLTVAAWFKTQRTSGNERIVSKLDRDANSKYYGYELVLRQDLGNKFSFQWFYGTTAVPFLHSTSTFQTNTWYFMAATFDDTTKKVNLYINGIKDVNTTATGSIAYQADWPLSIGRETEWQTRFHGTIDNVRIYDRALSAEEVWQLYWDGISEKAFKPYPADGAVGIDPSVILRWSPGKYAFSHDIYLGLDYNDVNDAIVDSDEYMGNFDVNSYDPNVLDIGVTYYWRIDEVNGPNVWKGNVWCFGTWPIIELSATQFTFLCYEGGPNPAPQVLTIRNSGGGTLNWEITYDCNWLTVNPVSGSSTGEPNEVTLSVDVTGLAVGTYYCNLTISDPNAENSPQTVAVTLRIQPPDCLIGGNAGTKEHSDWVAWGKPNCWCYCRQCRGDADGKKTLANWVSVPDLNMLIAAYGKTDARLAMISNGICSDLDHKKTLAYRVAIPDLNMFLTYYCRGVPPRCNQAPIITGPYNFWCDPTGCPKTCP